MCIDLLPEKLLQAIKKKEKQYERSTIATNILMCYLNLIIINFQNVPSYLYNFLFEVCD